MVDDFEAADIVLHKALIEIRSLVGTRFGWDRTREAVLDRIRFLAMLCNCCRRLDPRASSAD